jgi:hypothetical protein
MFHEPEMEIELPRVVASQSPKKGLAITDYEDIASRLEQSFELIDLIKTCLSTPENMYNLKS